jgi:putative oxidoreductase
MPDSTFLTTWSPRILSVLRIMAGLLILQYGTAKILGFPAWEYAQGLEPWSLTWVAGLIELVGGALVVLGLFTRCAAFVLSGEMAFAYFLGHASSSFFPIVNMGTEAALFCFVFLYIAAAGAGPWSVDAMMQPSERATVRG